MRLLSLDPSTKSTGAAIFDEQQQLIKVKCITASSSDVWNRIKVMVAAIDELIDQYQITDIVMEEVIPDHERNQATFKALMYLQSMIMFTLHEKHPFLKVTLILPGSWRVKHGIAIGRYVKREQIKQEDIRVAKEKFNLASINDDEADACLIGAAHLMSSAVSGKRSGGKITL